MSLGSPTLEKILYKSKHICAVVWDCEEIFDWTNEVLLNIWFCFGFGDTRVLQVPVGDMEEEAIRFDEVRPEGALLGVSPASFNCPSHKAYTPWQGPSLGVQG